jgi:hypothetical protein
MRTTSCIRTLTFGCILAFLLVDGTGCKKKPGASKADATTKRILSGGNEALAEAMRVATGLCTISPRGAALKCGHDAYKKLLEKQKSVGTTEAMQTYCLAVKEGDERMQALGAAQIQSLITVDNMKRGADAKVVDCLLDLLKSQTKDDPKALWRSSILVQAAGYMSTAIGKEKEMVALLESTELQQVKERGYMTLWANGRLRVFDLLAKVIREGKDVRVRHQALTGFRIGHPLQGEEKVKVCELTSSLMVAPKEPLFAPAARVVSTACPEPKEKILSAAEALIKQKTFASSFADLLGRLASLSGTAMTEAQRRRAISVLRKVLDDSETYPATIQKPALRGLVKLDEKLGKRLAKKYLKSENHTMQREAQRILGVKPSYKKRGKGFRGLKGKQIPWATKEKRRAMKENMKMMRAKIMKARMKAKAKGKTAPQTPPKTAPKTAPPKPTQ